MTSLAWAVEELLYSMHRLGPRQHQCRRGELPRDQEGLGNIGDVVGTGDHSLSMYL